MGYIASFLWDRASNNKRFRDRAECPQSRHVVIINNKSMLIL